MFDNLFVDQHRFDYYKPSDNEDDVDDEIIPLVSEFKDAYRSSFVISYNCALNHRHIRGESDLKVSQTFSNKNV
jgi:hypothetical protein